jgi:hypothetical protein
MLQLEIFLSNARVSHFCNRETLGPLSILPVQLASSRGSPSNNHSYTVHFGNGITQLPIIFGARMRYVSDVAPTKNWADTLNILSSHVAWQVASRPILEGETAPSSDPVDIEIFRSSSGWEESMIHSYGSQGPKLFAHHDKVPRGRHLSVDEQRRMAKELGPVLEATYTGSDGKPLKGNSVRFFPSADTPVCSACGSGVPA